MKKLLLALFLVPLSLMSQSSFEVQVQNLSSIKEIDGRKVEFGVKEKAEEFLIENGWVLTQKSDSSKIECCSNTQIIVTIDKIESPHRVLNIFGTKWLKKDYLVTVSVIAPGNETVTQQGKRSNFLFAAFLDVENSEVPLNRKSFSKSLESGLESCIKKIAK